MDSHDIDNLFWFSDFDFQFPDISDIDLPASLLIILRQKSSRIKSTYFQARLGTLLDYSDKHPEKLDIIGCKWIDDVTFIVNKDQLVKIFHYKERNGLTKSLKKFNPKKIGNNSLSYPGWFRCTLKHLNEEIKRGQNWNKFENE
jgi:hypothetical protein